MFLTLLKNILLKQYMLLFETNKKNKQKTKFFCRKLIYISYLFVVHFNSYRIEILYSNDLRILGIFFFLISKN